MSRGWLRISHQEKGPYWFFDPRAGWRGGVVIGAILFGVLYGTGILHLSALPAVVTYWLKGDQRQAKPLTRGVLITQLEGRVRVKHARSTEWVDADRSTVLHLGDLISTSRASTARLRFVEGSLFDVRPDSLIVIMENSVDASSQQASVAMGVETGQADFLTPGTPGTRRIATPNGRTTLEHDTNGRVQVASGGEAAVQIFKGKGQVVTRAGVQAQLGPNESLLLDASGGISGQPAVVLAKPVVPVEGKALRFPRLALDTLERMGTQLHVAGRTEAGVTVSVNGVPIPVEKDGAFNEHVVTPNATVAIQAAGLSGATVELRSPVASLK
jgi:hypothetical protein